MQTNMLPVILAFGVISGCSTSVLTYSSRSYDVLSSGGLTNIKAHVPSGSTPGEFFAAGSQQCVAPDANEVASLRRDFIETLNACNERLASYENKASQAKWFKFGLATVGGLAGTVIVPALAAQSVVSKSAVAAWGGLSGATNFAQESLTNESLAPSDFLTTRDSIRSDLKRAVDKYTNPSSDHCMRMLAVSEMASACIVYEISIGNRTSSTPP